jgi:hypothetical protein
MLALESLVTGGPEHTIIARCSLVTRSATRAEGTIGTVRSRATDGTRGTVATTLTIDSDSSNDTACSLGTLVTIDAIGTIDTWHASGTLISDVSLLRETKAELVQDQAVIEILDRIDKRGGVPVERVEIRSARAGSDRDHMESNREKLGKHTP